MRIECPSGNIAHMAFRSDTTFEEERASFQDIDGIFWEASGEFPSNPFSGIIEQVRDERKLSLDPPGFYADQIAAGKSLSDVRRLGRTGLVILDRRDLIDCIGKSAAKSDAEFANTFSDLLGIDLKEELEMLGGEIRPSSEGALQALTARFGTDAFGTYCPWHAFGKSAETPWGIYMFFEKLCLWAWELHRSGRHLPNPKPPLVKVFRLLWLITYRHELFHFHVELYATRMESAFRRPVYRPYVERVRAFVANTSVWWEEALAQAVVLKSSTVKRTLEIDSKYMNAHVVPYFRTFPEGYKQFECRSVGGEKVAHQIFSAQIARAQVSIPEKEVNTGLSLAKSEYRARDSSVPGYLVFRPRFASRFQLQTPRLRDVVRYVRSVGEIDEHAPGDHKRAKLNGNVLQINRAKRGDGIDLASAKALAKAMGVKPFDLVRLIG